ncbi:hypothetical protein PV327_003378 [Microctonus hyperodae]|uniref:Large ribosomal subunit protein uL18m n=1 Tax=Microctonus hyperodae TaxID=165561 RepID=A0AA39L147_MICHY|nr:hypothetical protein PV327_003378 [Microctonus hyperodae]
MNNLITRLQLLKPLVNTKVDRLYSNAALLENCENINNRNPRNLELLRIARKPRGFQLERCSRQYWHKLIIERTTRSVTLAIEHYMNGIVVSASTKEWPIKKQLYRAQDSAAYLNLGRILAQRCLESGIMFVHNQLESENCEKINLALTELTKSGISLTEPPRYHHPASSCLYRPEKPWEVEEK